MFSCEFCEISKNTVYYRTPLVAAFAILKFYTAAEQQNSKDLTLRKKWPYYALI